MLLGRYRARRLIKRGGFAEVFEAVAVGENGFERKVAIKRLLAAHAGDASLRRTFLDEARIASRLSHPNIVGIIDYGLADDLPFQVLDLVDGSDLSLLAEQPVPPLIAAHIACEVARALEYAHSATDDAGEPLRIVHRDVKPENILVSWTGDVKLADFGIAHARARLEETKIGVIKGTLAYMAPEQARGSMVDGRADVYALGCVLHRLIAGKSPLDDPSVRRRAIAGDPMVLDPKIPPQIAPIVARAIQWRREDRHPDAGAMADACWELISSSADREVRALLRDWVSALRRPEPPPVHPVEPSFELTFEGSDPELDVKVYTTVAEPYEVVRTVAAPRVSKSARVVSLGIAFALAMGAAFFVTTSSEHVAPRAIDPPPAPSVTAREAVEPVIEVLLPPAKQPETPRPKRLEKVRPRKPVDLEAKLARAMRRHGLASDDLDRDADGRTQLARFRAAPSEESLALLLEAMPAIAGAPPAIERRFRRVLESLKDGDEISGDALAELEARYFELRERFARGPSPEERPNLVRELRRLEQDVARSANQL